MEQPNQILGQIILNASSKIEEYLLIVIDKSTNEENLSQTLQANN